MNNHLKFALYVHIAQYIVCTLLIVIILPLVAIISDLSGIVNINDLHTNPEQYLSDIGDVFMVTFLALLFGVSYFTFKILYKKLKKPYHLNFIKSVRSTIILSIIISGLLTLVSKEPGYVSTMVSIGITAIAFYLAGKSIEEKKINPKT